MGLDFEVIPSSIDETALPGERPPDHVSRLAGEKAGEVAALRPESWVLGADTIVVIDDDMLGKPKDRQDAVEMLGRLAGRFHTVFTGYKIMKGHAAQFAENVVRSEVLIRSLSMQEIEDYIDTGEPMDKAGSYAIQGIGAAIVQSVSGSYTNVVGLPLCEVARDLKTLGIFDFLASRAGKRPK
jgi:septum formation protein